MCNCFGDKKKEEEEEEGNVVEEQEKDLHAESELNDDHSIELGDEKGPEKDQETVNYVEHQETNIAIPVVTVTDDDSMSTTSKKSKKSALKSVLKKITRPINKVRFGGVTESERSPLVDENQPPMYDSPHNLGPFSRSDSMESFVSSVSALSTANVEEFGEEVSPGRLQVAVDYNQRNWTLNIAVKQADYLLTTSKEKIYWQAHVALLPFKKHRFKTRYKSTSTPVFNQTYEVENIAAQALNQLSVRFRVYGRSGTTGRKKLAGEAELHLSNLKDGNNKVFDWLILKRKGQGGKKVESTV